MDGSGMKREEVKKGRAGGRWNERREGEERACWKAHDQVRCLGSARIRTSSCCYVRSRRIGCNSSFELCRRALIPRARQRRPSFQASALSLFLKDHRADSLSPCFLDS